MCACVHAACGQKHIECPYLRMWMSSKSQTSASLSRKFGKLVHRMATMLLRIWFTRLCTLFLFTICVFPSFLGQSQVLLKLVHNRSADDALRILKEKQQ